MGMRNVMTMMNDGGGGSLGSQSDVLNNLNNAVNKLKEIDVESVKKMIKLDDNDSSTSIMITAINNRITELNNLIQRFTIDSNKIESVRNRFNI